MFERLQRGATCKESVLCIPYSGQLDATDTTMNVGRSCEDDSSLYLH